MCPVCRARFRGSRECSRCGADLTMVMTLAASAWRARQVVRQALAADDFARMRDLASHAQQICYTEAGKNLTELGAWLSKPHGRADPLVRAGPPGPAAHSIAESQQAGQGAGRGPGGPPHDGG
jgi:hypothetical protein